MIIIPDIHGRTFWKEAAGRASEEKIVFLGDYLDHYLQDELWSGVTEESAIGNFREILDLKRAHPNEVILLLGNHDCEYIYGRNVCDCRCYDDRYDELQRLFRDNKELFQIAYERVIAGKTYILTHAGLQIEWLERYLPGWKLENVADKLNERNRLALDTPAPGNTVFAEALAVTDKMRGGDRGFASPVWVDARTLAEGYQLSDIVQIVGHTAIEKARPVITPNVIYADCSRALSLGDDGILRYLDGKECEITKGDPLKPSAKDDNGYSFGFDVFGRPFCKKCGSSNVHVWAGMFVDRWTCGDCGNMDHM